MTSANASGGRFTAGSLFSATVTPLPVSTPMIVPKTSCTSAPQLKTRGTAPVNLMAGLGLVVLFFAASTSPNVPSSGSAYDFAWPAFSQGLPEPKGFSQPVNVLTVFSTLFGSVTSPIMPAPGGTSLQ